MSSAVHGKVTLSAVMAAILAMSSLATPQDRVQNEPPPPVERRNGQPRVFSRAIVPGGTEEKVDSRVPSAPADNLPKATANPAAKISGIAGEPLEKQLQEIALRASAYLQGNQSKETGLYDSVAGYHHATMWDIASGLAGLVCAEKLGIIGRKEFVSRGGKILDSLQRMPLYNGELPNREYDIGSLALLDSHSHPAPRGSGWSTTDLGRLLIWLKIVDEWYPELRVPARQVVKKWNFKRLSRNGEAFGAMLTSRREFLRQEGRLGYEQYAATGFNLWGVKLQKALRPSSTESFRLFGTDLMRDTRNMAYLTSEPFFLARMEIGTISPQFDALEDALYEVQRQRWRHEGKLTAVSEDSIGQEPWFVYNTISAGREPWVCISPSGQRYPQFKSISTKAAVALWSVHGDAYSLRLLDAVKDTFHPSRGYYAGVFENGGNNTSLNLNTNAIILEAILYRRLGRRPFLQVPESDFVGTLVLSGRNEPSEKEHL